MIKEKGQKIINIISNVIKEVLFLAKIVPKIYNIVKIKFKGRILYLIIEI